MAVCNQLNADTGVQLCRGLDGKWRPNRRFDTAERDARIVRAHRSEGKSMRAIAREAGCSVGTVHRVLVAAN